MNCYLRRIVLGSPTQLPLTTAQFHAVKDAETALGVLADCEEKFDLAFDNFIELEADTAHALLVHMYRTLSNEEAFHDLRLTVARRVVNLLTSGKMYVDHMLGDLKRLKRVDLLHLMTEEIDKARSTSLNYEIAEALRDISQHRTLPVGGLTLSSRWLDTEGLPWRPRAERGLSEYSMTFYVQSDVLDSDRKLTADFKSRVKSRGGKIDLFTVVRGYMDSLGGIHQTFRAITEVERENWYRVHGDLIQEFKNESKEEGVIGLAAEAVTLDDSREQIYLIEKEKSRLVKLIERNRVLHNVSSRFFSTRIAS